MRRFLRRGFFGRGRKTGGTKMCTCPKCGHTQPSQRGIPCTEVKCPKCGTMMRGDLCL